MRERYYFAYGSNCNLRQMAHRCPAATKVGPVTLPDYKLTFNGKLSGTGVANVTPNSGTEVTGLLWKITPLCEMSLDRYEGYPHLYTKKTVTVLTAEGKKVKAMVYVMTPRYCDPALPSRAYLGGIIEGFRENGMDPEPVIEAVRQTERECDAEGWAV